MAANGKDDRIEVDLEGIGALDHIQHIVVLMLENRSFDHMLGYLRLSGRRPELDGLQPEMANKYRDLSHRFPAYDGVSFPVHELLDTKMKKSQDPPHDGASTDKQLKNGNRGFVQCYMVERGGPPEVHPRDVMGYHTERHLPVYDHLTEKFCVCDRWFSSVPGATMPNRLYAIAGRAAGSRDNADSPLYHLKSFVRHLDAARVSWGWFVHDLTPMIWAVDSHYPVHELVHQHVAWFDGHLRAPYFGDRFVQRTAAATLPSVSWIDPSFADLRKGIFRLLAPPSNDDHPPSDVTAGQALVLKLYDALVSSQQWKDTLLVITYDEHGGFYDHVPPPRDPPDDDPKTFSRYGVRVPAIVVSPWVGRRSFSHDLFDHTSIIKTILLRFCRKGNTIPNMGKRVSEARHLGVLLTEENARKPETPELYRPLADKVAEAHKESLHDELVFGATERAAAPTDFTDLQTDYLKIRTEFMKKLVTEVPDVLTRSF